MPDTDVAYILGHQDQYEELRYSLRSLDHFLHRRVWIAGAPPPDWSVGLNWIPVEQAPLEEDRWKRDEQWWLDRKLNMRRNLLAICDHPEVSDRFLYMNDDFFLLDKPGVLPTRGTIAGFADGPMNAPTQPSGPYPSIYYHLQQRGVADPLFISEHVPLLVDKTQLAEMMRDAWHIPGFPYASLWGNLADVEVEPDDKIAGDRLLVKDIYYETWPDHWWSVSTVHRSFFDWPAGERLRAMFPNPSPYER